MEWISTKNSLPSSDVEYESSRYLVYGKCLCGKCYTKNSVFEARFRRQERDFEFGEYCCPVEAICWMTLPEPPKD